MAWPAAGEARVADASKTFPRGLPGRMTPEPVLVSAANNGLPSITGTPCACGTAVEATMSLLASSSGSFGRSTSLPWIERPGRELLRLAWPITVSMISFSMMTLTSTAFVAHIGADELAGVGLAGVVGFALVCFGIGLLRGAKTLVSQAVGADRRDRIPELLGA